MSLKLKKFFGANAVPLIALTLAAVSMAIVPPDESYAGYFDVRTLACLATMMLVVGAYKDIRFFTFVAKKLINRLESARKLTIALVLITFIGSIFIANDMALLTFLPLTFLVFKGDKNNNHVIFTVTLQTIAANLGGMIMPFGNPQSLYLYSFYHIPVKEFVTIMSIPFAVAALLIFLCCFIERSDSVGDVGEHLTPLPKWRVALYFALAVIAVLAVFRVIDYRGAFCLVAGVTLIVDRKAFKLVDYGLLFTFFAFFIFANNMARIPAVQEVMQRLVGKSTLLTGVVSCQLVSNVPTAIFLSNFTADYKHLLLATNIGGCGTLVASLASLISFKKYNEEYPGHSLKYLGVFSLVNFAFLGVMVVICLFI